MKAIVLAAGFATRMYPLTRDRAKPLLDVGGRPVVEWLLDRLLALPAVDEVVLVTNARFHADFEAWATGLETRVPLRLVNDGAADERSRLGALGDLALALETIADEDSPLLVVAGDNLIDFDLAPCAARFEGDPARPLLLVRELEGGVPPGRYNEVVLTEDGTLASFREKPADPRSALMAICLYFLPADVRSDLRAYLAQGGNHDAPGHLMEWLSQRRSMSATPFEGTCHDIGNIETLERAREVFAQRERA